METYFRVPCINQMLFDTTVWVGDLDKNNILSCVQQNVRILLFNLQLQVHV
jgi:hypothetical protein